MNQSKRLATSIRKLPLFTGAAVHGKLIGAALTTSVSEALTSVDLRYNSLGSDGEAALQEAR